MLFFFNDTATTEIYTLSLHDALPISRLREAVQDRPFHRRRATQLREERRVEVDHAAARKREQLRLEDMAVCDHHTDVRREPAEALDEVGIEIGRASCRERV